jgi:hypothetical protein
MQTVPRTRLKIPEPELKHEEILLQRLDDLTRRVEALEDAARDDESITITIDEEGE